MIVINSVKNNSKALETTPCKTEQYKNSFFVKISYTLEPGGWEYSVCSVS